VCQQGRRLRKTVEENHLGTSNFSLTMATTSNNKLQNWIAIHAKVIKYVSVDDQSHFVDVNRRDLAVHEQLHLEEHRLPWGSAWRDSVTCHLYRIIHSLTNETPTDDDVWYVAVVPQPVKKNNRYFTIKLFARFPKTCRHCGQFMLDLLYPTNAAMNDYKAFCSRRCAQAHEHTFTMLMEGTAEDQMTITRFKERIRNDILAFDQAIQFGHQFANYGQHMQQQSSTYGQFYTAPITQNFPLGNSFGLYPIGGASPTSPFTGNYVPGQQHYGYSTSARNGSEYKARQKRSSNTANASKTNKTSRIGTKRRSKSSATNEEKSEPSGTNVDINTNVGPGTIPSVSGTGDEFLVPPSDATSIQEGGDTSEEAVESVTPCDMTEITETQTPADEARKEAVSSMGDTQDTSDADRTTFSNCVDDRMSPTITAEDQVPSKSLDEVRTPHVRVNDEAPEQIQDPSDTMDAAIPETFLVEEKSDGVGAPVNPSSPDIQNRHSTREFISIPDTPEAPNVSEKFNSSTRFTTGREEPSNVACSEPTRNNTTLWADISIERLLSIEAKIDQFGSILPPYWLGIDADCINYTLRKRTVIIGDYDFGEGDKTTSWWTDAAILFFIQWYVHRHSALRINKQFGH